MIHVASIVDLHIFFYISKTFVRSLVHLGRFQIFQTLHNLIIPLIAFLIMLIHLQIKKTRKFLLADEDTNAAIEAYHNVVKQTQTLSKRTLRPKRPDSRLVWFLIYQIWHTIIGI